MNKNDENGKKFNKVLKNVYAIGSNLKFLSSDIITEFRDRGDEIRIFSLPFKEFVRNVTIDISKNIVMTYIEFLLDSFFIEEVERYDVKGKKYIQTPQKYYFVM